MASTTLTKPAPRGRAATKSDRRRGMTPDDLYRLHLVASPRISPDGQRIVFVRKHVDEKNHYASDLWIVDADGRGEPVRFTSGGDDSHPRWSRDGSRIAFIRSPSDAPAQIHVISATGGEASALTRFPEGTIGGFEWSPDGSRLAVRFRPTSEEWTKDARRKREESGASEPARVIDDWWYRLDGDGYFGSDRFRLYLVDADTGDERVVYDEDTLGHFSFDFSPDSKRLAIATNRDPKAMIRPWKDEILLLTVASGAVRAVPGLPEGPKGSVAWSPDGRRLAYAGRAGRDSSYSTENLELFVCEPGRGRARSLTGTGDHCLMAVALTDTAEAEFAPAIRWSPNSRRIYLRLGSQGETHVASVPAAGGALTVHTTGAVDIGLGNVSDDGKRLALTVSTATRPPEIHVGRTQAGGIDLDAVTDFNGPLLREVRCAPITSRWIRTADGTRVQTWTMLPPKHRKGSRTRYPAVLEVHGGPHGQYGVGYFHEFQVLAAAGYAVFFSNPRGSKGYGRNHCAAIRGKWGAADWVDVQAVAEHMREHPNVDGARMGIMGGSYGGYMTNWAIGHTDVFAAAITDRCVSNLVSMAGSSDFVEEPDHYFPGNFWDRPEARWQQSPIRAIGNATTPTLIIHSEGDLRCNIEQAEQLFVALKLLDVPTRFVRYPRSTSHGLSRGGPPDLRVHRLEQILAWWQRWLMKGRGRKKR